MSPFVIFILFVVINFDPVILPCGNFPQQEFDDFYPFIFYTAIILMLRRFANLLQ
jgi:hypothetical protein